MNRVCSVDGCERKYCAKGYCKNHYYQLRTERCSVAGCNRALAAHGMCKMHWRRNQSQRECVVCGAAYDGDPRSKYCSTDCKSRAQRHPLRNALDDGDLAAALRTARESSLVTSGGCWEWQFATNSAGYGVLGQGGSAGLVHRRMLAVALGRELGAESVHHACANRLCINPEHLQLISQRENTAEMFARKFYVNRIAELESALRAIDSGHPIL